MLVPGNMLAARYRLERLLGEGGSARMWAAFDQVEQCEVGLKLLHDLPASASFRAEFARLRELSHPHLTRVRDYARAWLDGSQVPFYTCDLVEGETLRLRCERLGFEACEPALRDALSALTFLHRLGLCHGDVKPENVLVDGAGRGVLIDLGCAVAVGAERVAGGTPRFMAPELARGAAADVRADLFAAGLMLRELGAQGVLAALAERLSQADVKQRPSSLASALAELGLDWGIEATPLGRVMPLLGRSAQLEVVRSTLARVARREEGPRSVWVQAAHGLGSTRFLRELSFTADAGFDVFESSLEHDSLRALLSRAFTPVAPGVEALVRALSALALRPRAALLVLHDVQRGDDAKLEELMLALRATPLGGNLAWVVSSTRPPPPLSAGTLVQVALTPLGSEDLARWAGALVSQHQIAALQAHTGGFPLYVDRTLAALAKGAVPSEVLAASGQLTDGAEAKVALAALLSDLSTRERNLLACAALELPLPLEPSARLFERGLLQGAASTVRLARGGDAPLLLQLLPQALVEQLTARALDVVAADTSDQAVVRRLALLARAGKGRAALQLLQEHRQAAERAPRAFASAVISLAPQMAPAELVLVAGLLRQSGEPRPAVSLLARARRRAAGSALDALRLEAAECYLAQGSLRRARRFLGQIADPGDTACAECSVRLRVRQGDYQGAREVAALALATQPKGVLRARLHEGLALSCSYLAEHAEAEAQLDAADAADSEPAPRMEARRLALRGFVAVRRADPERALSAYERVLALADEHGLSDLVANALSNLASARHMLGSYGTARDLYERALRMARALGRRQSELLLRVNLANVALECGAFAEAKTSLEALSNASEGHGDDVVRALTRFRAELCLLTGQPEACLHALFALGPSGADGRDQNERLLLAGEAYLALGDAARAAETRATLERASAAFEPDLALRFALSSGRAALAEGREQPALAHFERALSLARAAGLLPLLAQSEAALAELYARTGAPSLEREHRRRAEARWERMALDLPAAARDAFWSHPLRANVRAHKEAPRPSQQSLSFVRIVELSRRINAQRTIDDVLSFALDTALELTSAERGFVLLFDAASDSFTVKSQRHIDPQPLESAPFAWSRGIAERVIATGEPVITLDAVHDPRFQAQASVHAMGLKSVLCVPISGSRGLKGALYLDNRYLRSRFTENDAALMQAFAEQVAVALGNAQLFAELAQKQRELLRKQRKVEELLKGKEREVELLSEALAEERAARGTRFSYDEMIGNSAGLRKLFATLDRVIPTDLPVIVRGESGTGKELVARAIHAQGPRAKGPFVGINCAALPENLLESELFGYVRGAFTGADRDKAGLLLTASGGTLFLDELAELPLSLQVKLLRVLTEREVRPLGATRSIPVDVRIVAATHRDLGRMLAEGSFREDLFYRLSVVEIALPALRERREDILPIAESLLARRAAQLKVTAKRLSNEAAQALLAYAFPGNVRELENILLRASALCENEVIRLGDLGLPSLTAALAKKIPRSRADFTQQESELLVEALKRERWNVSAVSRSLGIPRNTLYRRLSRLGLLAEVERAAPASKR